MGFSGGRLGALLVTLLLTGLSVSCVSFTKGPQTPPVNVIEKTDLSLSSKTITEDLSGYREFIKSNQQHGKPVEKGEYFKQVKDAQDYLEAHPSGKTAKDLKKKIREELNIDFLLQGLDSRALTVTLVTQRPQKGFTEEELFFEDPQVGGFSAFLLLPGEGKKTHSAILCLRGHDQDSANEVFKKNHFGEALAQRGFAVMVPTFRGFAIPVEVVINEELYSRGFTLMGLRIYETLLLMKYLRYKGYDKIGIMGHSAGSDIAYQVSILDGNVRALVYDMYPKQLYMVGGRSASDIMEGKFHCETIPGLAYYGPQMNGAAALKVPSRRFEYGYPGPEDFQEVMVFFEEKVR